MLMRKGIRYRAVLAEDPLVCPFEIKIWQCLYNFIFVISLQAQLETSVNKYLHKKHK
jgi:hypothetical protein